MKSHQWFKRYGCFSERVDFAYLRSWIRKGLHLQLAKQACFCIDWIISMYDVIKAPIDFFLLFHNLCIGTCELNL